MYMKPDISRFIYPLTIRTYQVNIFFSAPRGCTEDEGRSLGVGLQERAPNHLKLLW